MEEEQREFEVHKGHPRAESHSPYEGALLACKELENRLVQHQLHQAVDDLLNVCKSEYVNGIQGQIFPIQLHKNQEQELDQFLSLLEAELQLNKETIFPDRNEKMKEETWQNNERMKVVFLQGNEVRDLVLQMYIYLEEHWDQQIVIFIAREITDLSQHNLYCFEKALKGKQFISVLSTFSTFQSQSDSLSHTQYEKFHISLYHPKDLFCQFVYQCMANKRIKAYLPDGVFTLISDLDYYSISFRESCRRFRYCLERSLMLHTKERTWVDFDGLISLIEDVISKKFKLYCGYKNSLQKIIKVILSEKQTYTISEKAVSLELAMGARFSPILEENDLMNSIRQSLQKHLSLKPQFQGYALLLQEHEDQPHQYLKKKKSRFDQLGIDMKKNITPKNKLENQITRIIKQATLSIRQQASAIKWEDLKFELRIKPQIPLLIVKALRNNGETNQLTQEVLSEYASPVTKFFSDWEKEDYGRLIYLLKSLEVSGTIELIKKQQKPCVCTNHFEKASFCRNR